MKWTTKGVQVIKTIGFQVLIPAPRDEELNKLDNDTEYVVEIKKKTKRRSHNANSFCWVLCQAIAEALSRDGQYVSKEDVYRRAVKDSQEFEAIPVKDVAVDRWIRNWGNQGIGWLCENLGPCKRTRGYSLIACYYGSSVYSTSEMSRLIDCLIDEANQLGIRTEDETFIQNLLDDWGAQNEA